LLVTDIDTTDAFKELAVREEGPSDDPRTYFFRYVDGSIVSMGHVPGNAVADGSGKLRTSHRGNILHTWWYPAEYQVNPSHQLEFLERPLYEMGAAVKVLQVLPLYSAPDSTTVVGSLDPGQAATIVATDDRKWCLVETPEGLSGWFAVERGEVQGTGSQAHEVFEGLSFAD
jgi:hypothetical protein